MGYATGGRCRRSTDTCSPQPPPLCHANPQQCRMGQCLSQSSTTEQQNWSDNGALQRRDSSVDAHDPTAAATSTTTNPTTATGSNRPAQVPIAV